MADRRGDKGRHQARKRAVDLLFEAEARGITAAEVAEGRNTLAEKSTDHDVAPLNPYTVTVARGVTEHQAHVDDLISSHLQGWTLDRLPAVDRAILRVAVWELLHAEDVIVVEAGADRTPLHFTEDPGDAPQGIADVLAACPEESA